MSMRDLILERKALLGRFGRRRPRVRTISADMSYKPKITPLSRADLVKTARTTNAKIYMRLKDGDTVSTAMLSKLGVPSAHQQDILEEMRRQMGGKMRLSKNGSFFQLVK